MFIALGYYCLRLPLVSEFLTTAGLGFVVPGGKYQSDWDVNWQQYSQDVGGTSLNGSLRLQIAPHVALIGTFTNDEGGGKTYSGYLKGFLVDQGKRAEGIWNSETGQRGRFVFMLDSEARSFSGLYSLDDRDSEVNQANTWTGKKISK